MESSVVSIVTEFLQDRHDEVDAPGAPLVPTRCKSSSASSGMPISISANCEGQDVLDARGKSSTEDGGKGGSNRTARKGSYRIVLSVMKQ